MYQPKGVLAALATPMNDDETINFGELSNQVNRMIASGIHGLFCLGTNGEFYALSTDEKLAIMRTVKEAAGGRIPVVAGVGCVTTAETVRMSEQAQEIGVDALSVITPYFGQLTQDKMIAHYKSVAASVDMPVIIYNIPARTGNTVDWKTLEKLAGVKNITGIKDSSGNFDNILCYLEATGREFPVVAGNDSLILSTLTAGGTGAVAGCANIFPRKLASIYDLFIAGDIKAATETQDGVRAIRRCLSLGNPNSVIKRAACLVGQNLGPARKPFDVEIEKCDPVLLETIEKHYKNWD